MPSFELDNQCSSVSADAELHAYGLVFHPRVVLLAYINSEVCAWRVSLKCYDAPSDAPPFALAFSSFN